jgi:hypothetical protein
MHLTKNDKIIKIWWNFYSIFPRYRFRISKYRLNEKIDIELEISRYRESGNISNKCNYIVFSNNKSNQEEEDLDIKLFGENINKSDNPTFLGIRFDKYKSFKNQLDYLKEACMKRINVLKVLSNKSWGLIKHTLTQVYNSLIRSLLEYSSIIYPCFLQRI